MPRRRAAAQALLLAAGACVLAAGCSAGSSPAGATMGTAAGPARAAASSAHAPSAASPLGGSFDAGASAAAGKTAGLAAVPLPSGQSVIVTASLSLRTRNVQATVGRATQLAESAGGYVSGEHARVVQAGQHATPMVDIQFKVPAAAYQPTLTALGGLGTKRSETQRAQDVTGTVADVSSQVTAVRKACQPAVRPRRNPAPWRCWAGAGTVRATVSEIVAYAVSRASARCCDWSASRLASSWLI